MKALSRFIERASLEDAEAEPTPVVDAVEPIAEPVSADGIDALVEETPTPDAINSELEEVADIQESLESFGVLVDAAIARGGMRPEEGVMFQASLEHFQRRLGVAQTKLGLEDFGGTMSRAAATTVSQEALADLSKAAAQKIKELIARLVAFIKELTAGFSVKAKKVDDVTKITMEKVKETVKAGNGDKEVEVDLTKVTAITQADIDEKFSTLIASAKEMTTVLTDTRAIIKKQLTQIKILANDEGDLEFFEEHIAQLISPHQSAFKFANSGDKAGRKLTHAAVVTYPADGDMEVNYTETGKAGFTIKITASDMGTLGLPIFRVNEAVKGMTDEYAEVCKLLKDALSTSVTFKSRPAQEASAQADFDLSALIQQKLYSVVNNLSRARDQIGYFAGRTGITITEVTFK